MKSIITSIVLISIIFLLGSCKKAEGVSSITAEIMNETTSNLYLDMQGIEVHYKDEWVKLEAFDSTYNLNNSSLNSGLVIAPIQDIRGGKIDQIRLLIGDSSYYMVNNDTNYLIPPSLPSTYINIPVKLELINLGDYRFLFNIQAEKSIAYIDGKWHLNPNFILQFANLY